MDMVGIAGWVLFVIASAAGGNGGVAINTDLWFHEEAQCRAAAKAMTEQQSEFKIMATCIEVPSG